jgi:hypothetical protein
LDEEPPERREPPPAPVHASRPGPITPRVVGRVLGIATLVGLFLVLLSPANWRFGPLLMRAAQVLGYSWIGALVGLACVRAAWRLGLWTRGYLAAALASGLLMIPIMVPVVWIGISIRLGHRPPLAALPEIAWQTGLICLGACAVATAFGWRGRAAAVQAGTPAPPKFLERLPLKLRGAEVWAVEAEDHYLRLHTAKGQDLILMRLSDAVAELDGIEGAQVHRSWWVARDAIADARRGDGRATLTLKDGSQVPVSRTYARILREKNWI